MKLKKLQLAGFKSFADKTALVFSPGITAIVGPNGCGKSNIADAFRWVLGEQSAKSLRGNKMPDVIFAGAGQRSPLNIAEVTLTLSNCSGLLPIQYEEVEITRRLHRSGESEYLLNRQNVRLKDIQDLLLDSGVGKDAFSIFEQGKLDQVIQYSPLERRYVFEETAGILRFLHRKREALRKLEQVDLNLSRVRDIHREVEQQISILEQQATLALVYREQKERLELLEKVLFVRQFDQLQQKLHVSMQREIEQRQQLETSEIALQQLLNDLEGAKSGLDQKEGIARDANETLYRIRSDKNVQLREKQSIQERLSESQTKEEKWQKELSSLDNTGRTRQTESDATQKRQWGIEQEVERQKQLLQEQCSQAATLEEAVAELRRQHQGAQQERLKALQKENAIDGDLKQQRFRQEMLQEKHDTGLKRSAEMQESLSTLQHSIDEKKAEQQISQKSLDEQKTVQQRQMQQLKNLSKAMEELQNSYNAVQGKLAELKARHKVLLRMREEHEGFSVGSKKLLLESSNPKSPLFGILKGLYECFSPKPGAEAALASVLRPYAQTLVVATKEHLFQVAAFAKEAKLKDFSLLCLEAIPAVRQSKETIPAEVKSLLQEVELQPQMHYFLKHTYTASDLANALELMHAHPQAAIWVADGAFFDDRSVLFFSHQGEQNVFTREAELKKLEKDLVESEKTREQLASELALCIKQRSSLEMEQAVLDKGIHRSEIALIELSGALQRLNSDVTKLHAEEARCKGDAQGITDQIAKINATLSELSQQHVAVRTVHQQIQERCVDLDQQLQMQLVQLKAEKDKQHTLENSYKLAVDEQRKLQHQLQLLEVRQKESAQQERRLREEMQFSQESKLVMNKRIVELTESLKDLEKAEKEAAQSCQHFSDEVRELRLQIEQRQTAQQDEKAHLAKVQSELTRLDLQKQELSSSLKDTIHALQERFNSTIEEVQLLISPEAKLPTSVEQAERQIRALRREMEAAGNINMTSIEECKKHKARQLFLAEQIKDLEDSRQELMEIILSLDNESRKLFRDTVEAIRINFKKHFKTLFNGGEADLQFTEAADILEAGIEIVAKPPGKHMCSISLLSGGEKCLTAMALLFALFEVKPAPFCILDEIDAPLDDANVGRFVQVVKEFTDRCQFIIITHHKRTMEIADLLCGVTMQEKGVSKMLTMEMVEAEAIGAIV